MDPRRAPIANCCTTEKTPKTRATETVLTGTGMVSGLLAGCNCGAALFKSGEQGDRTDFYEHFSEYQWPVRIKFVS
ncbi:hypothetical protein LBMAG46_13230 [Planctomycetia bacterium]|nr:hypothetical protein LBMAG46_13230 [Planctomycetia bacterium]